jgi:hypothetical protein
MSKLLPVPAGTQDSALREAQKTHQTLSGGLNLAEGTYPFTVAKEKAFGILEVNEKWALPVVAGTMEVNGRKEEFILSEIPGAKTLVVPDVYFTSMEIGCSYNVTIGARKGRKVVTSVEKIEEEENLIPESEVTGSRPKRHKVPTL